MTDRPRTHDITAARARRAAAIRSKQVRGASTYWERRFLMGLEHRVLKAYPQGTVAHEQVRAHMWDALADILGAQHDTRPRPAA